MWTEDTTQTALKLAGSVWGQFSWSLCALGIVFVTTLLCRAFSRPNGSTCIPTIARMPRIMWIWPIYIWGLESVVGMILLMNWHNVHYGTALQPVQRFIISSLYCLTILVAGTWVTLRLRDGAEGPKQMRGTLGWSFHLSILSVVAAEVGVFVAAFRLAW